MSTVRKRGEPIRRFLVENLDAHPADIVRVAMEEFGISRQAVHKHLVHLVDEGVVLIDGQTRNKTYRLAPLLEWQRLYQQPQGLSEDRLWSADIAPALGKLPENVLAIWQYGFTEMFNNVIDHSEAPSVLVSVKKTAATATVVILDDGVGIFRKITAALGLADERHAVLELAKGKFTTDPKRHSGEGIYFTSRMFDAFAILSGDVYFSHDFGAREDWILKSERVQGTTVRMVLHNHTARTCKQVFDDYTTDDDYGFTRTVVPVNLMQYGDANLVSRSQAKRLLSGLDRFKVVVLDFAGVASIGQAFADEVFRVFVNEHPEVELQAAHTTTEVGQMISRARQPR